MAKTRPNNFEPVDADLAWGAACAAYRINGGYNKQPVHDKEDYQKIVAPANKELVALYITEGGRQFITEADMQQGRVCRNGLKQQTTMDVLKNRAGEWTQTVAKVVSLDTIGNRYDLAVLASLPKSYDVGIKRDAVDARLARCETTAVGKLKDRIELAVEIVKAGYSIKFNTHFVTGITEDNHAVFFAYREHLKSGDTFNITGTIKRHDGRVTQLNRVKLLEKTK